MTTYLPPHLVYQRVLAQLIDESPSEAACLARIGEICDAARREREEASAPGWTPPAVSYIPAYGAEETIEAIKDFDRLRSILAVDCHFRDLLLSCLKKAGHVVSDV
jgi:hypothetical protein